MANTSITIEELRQRYNAWRTAWRSVYHGLAGTKQTSAFAIPKSYKYIRVFSTYDPDSIGYPYVLNYNGTVDAMPLPLYVCNSEHYIREVNSPDSNFRCFTIEMATASEVQINNPLQIQIRMEEV